MKGLSSGEDGLEAGGALVGGALAGGEIGGSLTKADDLP